MGSPAIGTETIVKFFQNTDTRNTSSLITRTLMKVGFIDRAFRDNHNFPQALDGEFWKVRIVEEIKPGERCGCFLLQPLEKISTIDLCKLLQGMYEEKYDEGLLLIYPKDKGFNWVMPLSHKKIIDEVYSIIVSL